jgi:hypothetical protein
VNVERLIVVDVDPRHGRAAVGKDTFVVVHLHEYFDTT